MRDELLAQLIKDTENWVKSDPRWALFQAGCGKGWDIRFREQAADEVIDWNRKIAWLAMFRWPDPIWRSVHLVAHIRDHPNTLRPFTEEEESYADDFAHFWTSMTCDGSGGGASSLQVV